MAGRIQDYLPQNPGAAALLLVGLVKNVDATEGTCDVDMGGSLVEDVPFVAGAVTKAGVWVNVLQASNGMMVIGSAEPGANLGGMVAVQTDEPTGGEVLWIDTDEKAGKTPSGTDFLGNTKVKIGTSWVPLIPPDHHHDGIGTGGTGSTGSTGGGGTVQPIPLPGIPSTPLVGTWIGTLKIDWDGKAADGTPYLYPQQWVEVHVSQTQGFTPDASTFRGHIWREGFLALEGLKAGETYYVRFVGVNADGQKSQPGAEASGVPRWIITSDIGQGEITPDDVSFDASAIGGIKQTVGPNAPANPKPGDQWIDTSPTGKGEAKVWRDGAWHSLLGSLPADIQAAVDAANIAAQGATQAANGKNRVFYQATPPTTGLSPNDIWFDTSRGYAIFHWTGSAWDPAPLGSAALAPGSVTASQIAQGAVTGIAIANGAVLADHIVSGAITAGKIAADAVTANTIAAGAITAGKLSANAVTAGTVAADAIQARNIAADAITAKQLAAGAITAGTAIIADGAIRSAQISNLDAAKITSGFIDAARIQAGSLTADRIAAGSWTGQTIANAVLAAGTTLNGNQPVFYVGADGVTIIRNNAGTSSFYVTANDMGLMGPAGGSNYTAIAGARIARCMITTSNGTAVAWNEAESGWFAIPSLKVNTEIRLEGSGFISAGNSSTHHYLWGTVHMGAAAVSGNLSVGGTLYPAGFDCSGGIVARGDLLVVGQSFFPNSYGRTVTAGQRAAYLDGDTWRTLSTMQSSIRVKRDVNPFRVDTDALLGLELVSFRYKGAQDTAPLQVGVIAEQADELGLGWLCGYDEHGKPDYFAYERLALGLLEVVRNQQSRIAALEDRLDHAA